MPPVFLFVFDFEIGVTNFAQAGLELKILLTLPPE
jgi:hypothetical protein